MAFIQKSGKGYCVRKGNTGQVLSCFRGKDAKKKAEKELAFLHRKNMPKASNRGKRAMKANEARKKKK